MIWNTAHVLVTIIVLQSLLTASKEEGLLTDCHFYLSDISRYSAFGVMARELHCSTMPL